MSSAQGIRAGRAYVEIGTNDTQLVKGLRSVQARLRSFGLGLAAIGGVFDVAGSSILGPMLAAARQFSTTGDMLDKMRARTGFTAESLSLLGFAAEQSGASIDQLDRSLAGMARFSLEVERGLKSGTDLLNKLGISVNKFKSVSAEERFKLLAEAISKIEDPTLRAGIALDVFGRSGRELLPMLADGRAGIEALEEEARQLGLVWTEEDATLAAELNDAMGRVWAQLKHIVKEIGAAVAPALITLQKVISPIIKSTIEWIRDNRELVVVLGASAAAMIAFGTTLLIVGSFAMFASWAIGGLITLLGILPAIGAFLISPTGILAGIAALGFAIAAFTTDFSKLSRDTAQIVSGIVQALTGGQIELAGKIAFTGLKLVVLQILNDILVSVDKAIQQIIGRVGMLTAWSRAVTGGKIAGDKAGAWMQSVQERRNFRGNIRAEERRQAEAGILGSPEGRARLEAMWKQYRAIGAEALEGHANEVDHLLQQQEDLEKKISGGEFFNLEEIRGELSALTAQLVQGGIQANRRGGPGGDDDDAILGANEASQKIRGTFSAAQAMQIQGETQHDRKMLANAVQMLTTLNAIRDLLRAPVPPIMLTR